MDEQTWKRKEYETWDEAFHALAPIVRQQSVRVASYTQTLFTEACAVGYGAEKPEWAEEMKGKYADLAYKCGLYHQIGKALVPTEYQIYQKDFTDEETAVYRKYTTDGRLLAATLQERTLRAKERRTGKNEEPTENIPWMMIREACEQHMERFDGTGYPAGRTDADTSPIAKIVGLAKELDRLASETKSENPFAEAFDAVTAQSGTAFSPELIEILKKSRAKCLAVYKKYIHYTLTLPKTIPLVEKRKDRPMGLTFRPIVDAEGVPNAYEAVPWFGGIAEDPGIRESAAEIETQMNRLGMVVELSTYFLYEATDALLRVQNCKLSLDAILLEMMPAFYSQGSQLQMLNQIVKDQEIDPSRLLLTISQDTLLSMNKENTEIVRRYMKNGFCLLLDDWQPEAYPLERINEMGFRYVRPKAELFLKHEMADLLRAIQSAGITVFAKNVDNSDAMLWLAACGVRHMEGTLSGETVDEDSLIRDTLLRERENG